MIRLEEGFYPPTQQEVAKLVERIQKGPWEERKTALAKLVLSGAEEELVNCLTSEDPLTCQLATAGLWECWLNEEGAEARLLIDAAIDLMESEDWLHSEKLFRELSMQYPSWAEPVHKRASVLFLRGSYRKSFELYEWVVDIKPHHFGAWHGLAQCAVKLRDWETALHAAEEDLRIHPRYNSNANLDIIRQAEAKLF